MAARAHEQALHGCCDRLHAVHSALWTAAVGQSRPGGAAQTRALRQGRAGVHAWLLAGAPHLTGEGLDRRGAAVAAEVAGGSVEVLG